MEYEWDDAKAAANYAKHGIEFEVAAQALEDTGRVEGLDLRRDYGELRVKATGMTQLGLVTVIHTRRGSVVRLISARKANRREREAYGNR